MILLKWLQLSGLSELCFKTKNTTTCFQFNNSSENLLCNDLNNLVMKIHFKTQYMRNSTIIFPIKMEYVSEINIFALKMMMKSGQEKIFF